MRQALFVFILVTYSLLAFGQAGNGTGKGGGPGIQVPVNAPPGRGPGPQARQPEPEYRIQFDSKIFEPLKVGAYIYNHKLDPNVYGEMMTSNTRITGNLAFALEMFSRILNELSVEELDKLAELGWPTINYTELQCAERERRERCDTKEPFDVPGLTIDQYMTARADCLARIASDLTDSNPLCAQKINVEVEKYRTEIADYRRRNAPSTPNKPVVKGGPKTGRGGV